MLRIELAAFGVADCFHNVAATKGNPALVRPFTRSMAVLFNAARLGKSLISRQSGNSQIWRTC